jgi:hypothetical protein
LAEFRSGCTVAVWVTLRHGPPRHSSESAPH